MIKVFQRLDNIPVATSVEDIMAETGKTRAQCQAIQKTRVVRILMSPCYGKWLDLSKEYNAVIDQYRGRAKLVKYKPSEYEKRKMKENPDYANDIPRYYVPGLDRALGSDQLDRKMRDEFYQRFLADDAAIVTMTNECNRIYRAELA